MSPRDRLVVGVLLGGTLLAGGLVVTVGAVACPVELPGQPCPDAGRNVAVVLILAAATVGIGVTPFAFLGEFVARRRIVFRGAWWRAARRGALAGLLVAALAGLRLGGALTVPVAIFAGLLAVVVDRLASAWDV